MMMGEEAVSLFIAVYSFTNRQVSLIQLKTPQQQQEEEEEEEGKNLYDFEVVRFLPPDEYSPLSRWYVSPTTSSSHDFYLFPSCNYLEPPLHSYKFNFMTATFLKIKPPGAPKHDGFVVNPYPGRHTYFVCALKCPDTNTEFEYYHADQDKWEALKPIPNCPFGSCIVATAAWDATIMFFLDNPYAVWAYNINFDHWYDVHVDDPKCYCILGKAVVLQDTTSTTIYALSDLGDTILALSLGVEGGCADPFLKLSLLSEISFAANLDTALDDYQGEWMPLPTKKLLHLGKDNFCLVKAGMVRCLQFCFLYIQLTYMLLTRGQMATVMECYHKLNIPDLESLDVVEFFFLPECKATALGRGKRLDFQLDPHEYQSVYVRKLPLNATVEQVEKTLNVFGPVVRVRDGIQIKRKKKKCFALVEFESAASKQDAIKAGRVFIGGCWAEINDKKSDEVHSVYVSNLPRYATVEQVKKKLNVYGPIVRDGIQVNIKKKTMVFAFVEFQSAASKQRAIEAATVYFGDHPSNISASKRKMKKNQPHTPK